MNSYRSLRQRNNGSTLAVVSLAMCVLISATVLFSRLLGFVPADTQHYIPLTRSAGSTVVTIGQMDEQGDIQFRGTGYDPRNHRLLTAKPGIKVYDKNTVWKSQTDIEIFHLTYNETGDITVESSNKDKLIAPGTRNTYKFTLENTGNVALDYKMSMKAWFTCESNPDIVIPVLARVTDYKGNYLAGSKNNLAPVMDLNKVSKEGKLTAGYVAPFTLEWEWPFEGDDVFDTMLGNMAVDEDLTLTIEINVLSSQDTSTSTSTDSGLPKTGDSSHIQLFFTVMMVSGFGLLILLALPMRKRRKNYE